MSENSEESTVQQHTGIFDENHPDVLEVFGSMCEQVKINTSIAIIQDPTDGKPKVFIRGHLYDVGHLVTKVANQIKKELMQGLSLLVIIIGLSGI